MFNPLYRDSDQYVLMCDGSPQELPDDFVRLEKGQSCSYPKWKYYILNKIDSCGTVRIWQSGFNGTHIWTLVATYNTGTIYPRLVEVNNSGRTLQQQAQLEILKLYKDKEHDGYYPINTPNYTPLIKGMKGVNIKESTKVNWSRGLIADVKLDGLRMMCYTDQSSGDVEMRSNGNESYNYINHIREQVIEFMNYIPQGAFLDGELYNHDMDTPDIQSAVTRKVSHSPNITRIKYFIFDMDWSVKPCVEDRYETLVNAYNNYVASRDNSKPNMLTYTPKFMVFSYDDAIEKLGQVIELGYEGLVLRRPGRNTTNPKEIELSQYKPGSRTVGLLKLKASTDEEAPVIGVIDGVGKASGLGILILRDQITGQNITLQWGTENDRRSWFLNPSLVIGRILCFYYAKRDRNSNLPIHPAGRRWRDNYD